ncbi:DUF4132 domain-containing protein [Spirillospora sp. NBC_01491]|uniref:DUF4132 domain-containing protein n=1 Tax=Spirillospora sp. NBC_01491 TaxID=2976007 RepID=UPI002E337C71|nr:DUF4132 domain-containing protein [Spirillospora sp. NBC_01491]
MSDQSPNEDQVILPESLRGVLYPRRGGAAVPVAEVDGSAVAAVREVERRVRPSIDLVVAEGGGPGDPLGVAGRIGRHLDGAPDPVGAAAIARIALSPSELKFDAWLRLVLDAWAAEHGLPFAACAFVEFCRHEFRPPGTIVELDDFEDPWWRDGAVRVRSLLAVADERVYQEAVDGLAAHRGTRVGRLVVSFLVPTRVDWVDECCAALPNSRRTNTWLWWSVVSTTDQVANLDPCVFEGDISAIATAVDGLGDIVTYTLAWDLDIDVNGPDARRGILDALSALPDDRAFEMLVNRADQRSVLPALAAAAEHFPVRTLRMLAPRAVSLDAASGSPIAELVAGHLRMRPELAEAAASSDSSGVLSGFSDDERTAARILATSLERVAEAPASSLPALLTEPPWTRKGKGKGTGTVRAAARPVVIAGLVPPSEQVVAWAPGERERWASPVRRAMHSDDHDWRKIIAAFRAGRDPEELCGQMFGEGPEDVVRPFVKDWNPYSWDIDHWLRPVMARFEGEVRPMLLKRAEGSPAAYGGRLLPFLDAEVAALMARWLTAPKAARPTAVAWFSRHGAAAVPLLVPDALGEPGRERGDAETALRFVAAGVGADAVVQAARVHGGEAADAVAAFLAVDPLEVYPVRPPKARGWAAPELLPQVLLRDTGLALPDEAVRHVVTMLAMTRPGEAYAGVEVVRELCEPGSLAAFGWALFQRWRIAGADAKSGWALAQLGRTGDDGTVRRLTSLIRAWPGDGGHAKAVAGLEVLAEIGSDVALTHLHKIAERMRYKGLKARARAKAEEVAAALGLTSDQLADRVVPGFGLAADGSMTLDYGPRRFRVGFDEQLRPYVADEDGTRRRALPRPNARDDARLAPAAAARYALLKKDVRATASREIGRLKEAMASGRRWAPADFREHLIGHPLLWHIVRRLVWLCDDGGVTTAFRLAEDRTFADVDDDLLTPSESARIRVAHPVDLGDRLNDWAEVLADYEVLQPFAQVVRVDHLLLQEERASSRLKRFEGIGVPLDRVLALPARGWELGGGELGEASQSWAARDVPGGRRVTVVLGPGPGGGRGRPAAEHRVVKVFLGWGRAGSPSESGGHHHFGEVDPVAVSEILAGLAELTAPVRDDAVTVP